MAAASRTMVVLMIVVASACLDVCKACGVCGTPSTPVYKPPKTPTTPTIGAPPYFLTPPSRGGQPLTPPSSPGGGGGGRRTCPVALLELSVCSPLLGSSSNNGCCALLGLLGVDLELCLCLALDANILGLITVDAKINVIASILTSCGYTVPSNFRCPF